MVKFKHLVKLSSLFSVFKILNAALFQGAAGLESYGEVQLPQGLESSLDAGLKIISGDSGETDYEYEYNESGPSLDEADLAVNGGNLAVKSMDEANALLDALIGVRHDDNIIESNYVTEISDSTSLYSDNFDQSDQLFYQILRF